MTEDHDPTDDAADAADAADATEATRREGRGHKRAAASEPRLERGTLVGRYVILDVLGQGGMGIVYAAWDPELDRRVAIKLLQAKSAGDSSGGDQAWLMREAQALARLSHPNVVGVHDVGMLPGDRIFIAMELVEGSTLRAWLKEKPRTWRDVQAIMLGAGTGLSAAHAAGLVHRDFKPENVLIGHDGRVRVMDFGLARLQDDDDPSLRSSNLNIEARSPLSAGLTVAGSVVGTPAYMAPELYEEHPADARSDQFSFGVALYEGLYRTRPFEKKALIEAHQTPPKPKPPPTDLGVPRRIERVVMRAIAINPDERFRSMDDLLAALGASPPVTARRVAVVAGLLAIAGAGIGFGVTRSHPVLCKGGDRRLAGAWDSAVKQHVQTAFIATGRPMAGHAYDELAKVLDGYATEWNGQVVESCEATRIRGEQTEEVLSLRQDCLDQRLEELRAFTQLLATADESIVDKAANAAMSLEPIKNCANVPALRAPGLVPVELRPKVEQVRMQLADAKAGLITGKLGKAINSATAAAEGAKTIPFEPVEAEARLVLGQGLFYIGNSRDAVVALERSIWLAYQTRREDVVAVAALSAATAASGLHRTEEARVWLALANAAAARLGPERTLVLRLLEAEGIVEGDRNDLIAAVTAHEKALALAIQLFGREGTMVANDEQLLAAALARTGNWAAALPHYEHAHALLEAYLGPEHSDVAVILTGLGSCYHFVGESDKAHHAFERAIEIDERVFGKDSPILISALNNTAETLRDEGAVALAIPMIERAKAISERTVGRAHPYYHNVATTYAELLMLAGRVDEARALFDEVIKIEERTQGAYLAYTLMARGRLSLHDKKWAEAAAFDERSIALSEAASGPDAPELWKPLTGLAQAKIGLGHAPEARPLLERALAIADKAHVPPRDVAGTRTLLEQLPK